MVSDSPNPSGNVDNFVPEVGLERGFLEDGGTAAKSAVKSKKKPTERAPILDSDR